MSLTLDDFRCYGYSTSTPFIDPKKVAEMNKVRFTNLERFITANPNVVSIKGSIHCQRHVRDSGSWKCYRNCPEFHNYPALWDHLHAMRITGLKRSYFAVTHPYMEATDAAIEEDALRNNLLEGLTAQQYNTERDWYSPKYAYLFLIGKREVLECIDTECLGDMLLEVNGSLKKVQ